jgi:hypothetical protein
MFKGVSWSIPTLSTLYFGQFYPFHYSPLPLPSHHPIIQQLSIHIVIFSICTDVIYFDIVYSIILSEKDSLKLILDKTKLSNFQLYSTAPNSHPSNVIFHMTLEDLFTLTLKSHLQWVYYLRQSVIPFLINCLCIKIALLAKSLTQKFIPQLPELLWLFDPVYLVTVRKETTHILLQEQMNK